MSLQRRQTLQNKCLVDTHDHPENTEGKPIKSNRYMYF